MKAYRFGILYSLGMWGMLGMWALGAASACSPADSTPETLESPETKAPSPRLEVEVVEQAAPLTPVVAGAYDERSTTLHIVVSGFINSADAGELGLNIEPVEGLQFALAHPPATENAKTFHLSVSYNGTTAFPEGFVSLHFSLTQVPEGYAYSAEKQSLRLAIADGQTKARAIPLRQSNIEAFNSYAHTAQGLKLHYQLTESIVLPPLLESAQNWRPIGTLEAPFEGSLDGNNHSLWGLRLDLYTPEEERHRGLFGVINAHATIENLGVLGFNIAGFYIISGVVGLNQGGTVQNCYVAGNLDAHGAFAGGVVGLNEGGMVRNCYTAGGFSTQASRIGGIVGVNDGGTIENCYVVGSVTSTYAVAGGVAGSNSGTVQNCYATGHVTGSYAVGGVVGMNSGTVQNCYATGHVSGYLDVGGVAGQSSGTVQNCYATGSISTRGSSGGSVGGIVGYNERSSTTRNCVALNRTLYNYDTSTYLPPNIGRVAGRDFELNINYAQENMTMVVPGLTINLPSSALGPSTLHGQSIALEGPNSAGDLQWWTTATHWAETDGASAWDFENIWQWGPTHLPILRNVGGRQTPLMW
ncbi:MAG: hypothetical protein FWG75_02190 [Cystobacterineae bacterium]|nr:hypothetical protein [Cystobacterineae bacterium]